MKFYITTCILILADTVIPLFCTLINFALANYVE